MTSDVFENDAGSSERLIGRYLVLSELGRGAMGKVYKARDPQLDRLVAIKTLRTDLGLAPEIVADFKKRFYREAMAAGRLNHPNIVAIHDVLEIAETPYIIMEYVDGRTLSTLLVAEGPLEPKRAVEIVVQACHALEYAHARGIVHRDIKPANILVSGGRDVKVSDFGIARISGTKFTQTGAMVGSPSYMSPEQVRGTQVDGRSDLFALGVVLYEILCGVDPFSGESPSTVLYKIVHEEPPPVPDRNPAVPPVLDAVIHRALAKDPDRRYPTARAFAEALKKAMEPAATGATTLQDQTVIQPLSPKGRRMLVAGVGAGCAALVVVAGALLWGRSSSAPAARGGPGQQATPAAAASAPPSAPSSAPASSGSSQATPAKSKEGAPAKRESARRDGPSVQGPGARAARAGGERPSASPAVPAAARTGRGSIRITSNPAVEILVDGQPVGRMERSPFVLDGLPVGEHAVTLRLGSQAQRFRVTVLEGQPYSLTHFFAATPPPAAAAPASPPQRQEPPPAKRETPVEKPEPPKKEEPPSLHRPPDPS
jgi:serine/threonine-protein kinase